MALCGIVHALQTADLVAVLDHLERASPPRCGIPGGRLLVTAERDCRFDARQPIGKPFRILIGFGKHSGERSGTCLDRERGALTFSLLPRFVAALAQVSNRKPRLAGLFLETLQFRDVDFQGGYR